MKFATVRPFADPETAARKLVEIANSVEAVQDGRIHIELVNAPFLYEHKASPDEARSRRVGNVTCHGVEPCCGPCWTLMSSRSVADAQGAVRRSSHGSKDELDAYHLDAPPNDFANPMLAAFEKRQFETIRDNGVNHDLRAMF
jgi:hypothetical protein